MKGMINKSGFLHIERAGRMKIQDCPFAADVDIHCGDWCPLFGEPIYGIHPTVSGSPNVTRLYLCYDNALYFDDDDFVDERSAKNENS